MQQPLTDQRLAANRANARKSTGPKSPEGKRHSSLNALKHGLLTKHLVIPNDPNESPSEFASLLQNLIAEHQPEGALQLALIERIAGALWRLRRCQRFESAALARAQHETAQADHRSAAHAQCAADLTMAQQSLLISYEQLEPLVPLRQDFAADLQRLRAELNAPPPPPGFGDVLRKTPESKEFHIMRLHRTIPDQQKRERQLQEEMKTWNERIASTDPCHPGLDAIPRDEDLNRLIRYESMIERQLHRALADLRRLQARPRSGGFTRRCLSPSPLTKGGPQGGRCGTGFQPVGAPPAPNEPNPRVPRAVSPASVSRRTLDLESCVARKSRKLGRGLPRMRVTNKSRYGIGFQPVENRAKRTQPQDAPLRLRISRSVGLREVGVGVTA